MRKAGCENGDEEQEEDGSSSEESPNNAASWELVNAEPECFIKETAHQSNNEDTNEETDNNNNNDDDGLTVDQIAQFQQAFDQDSTGTVAQNAVARQDILNVTLSRSLLQSSLSPVFSVNLLGSTSVTNQQDSGRCWMFATLNLFRFNREKIRSHLGSNFEFSESYLFFFWLLEQANFFLNKAVGWAHDGRLPPRVHDRVVAAWMEAPIDDGGDWMIAMNLIEKYGLVPKTVYPETFTSNNTWTVGSVLTNLLRNAACQIQQRVQHGDAPQQVEQFCHDAISQVYRILSIHLGTPPGVGGGDVCNNKSFVWQWRDAQDGTFHREEHMTPQKFCCDNVAKPGTLYFVDYVTLIQDPRHDYYERYTVRDSMPIQGGKPTIFINISADEMKQIAIDMLQDGLPVWFACNVDEECDNDDGLWDEDLYQMAEFYNLPTSSSSSSSSSPAPSLLNQMSKADRIRYGYPMGTHVMLLTAVDLVEQESSDNNNKNNNDGGSSVTARRWRVENSWGGNAGNGGYYTMNDNWFNRNVFEIAAPKKYLSEAAAASLQKEVTVLPEWDPMASSSSSPTCRRGGQWRWQRRSQSLH